MSTLQFITAHSGAIEQHIEALGLLRIAVFRDFPYLYEGDLHYERAYLDVYVRSAESLLFAVYDDQRMVGATTALPLAAETLEVQQPWRQAGYEVADIYYFGESILLPAYRGIGLGHRFFDEREQYMAALGKYKISTFCAVDRPLNHPLRPAAYRPNDAFWTKRGYTRMPELHCNMHWKDVDQMEESNKTLTFWMKTWS
jgi:GNAT superfamily N-acetyltransferase